MKKCIYHLYGIGICLCIVFIVIIIDKSNNIYAWTLGDLAPRYETALKAVKSHDYITARQELVPLAGIDSAKFSQFTLGDLYYRSLGGETDYDKAYKLFKKSAMKGIVAGYNVYNSQKTDMMFDLALANVKALARYEITIGPWYCIGDFNVCLHDEQGILLGEKHYF